MLNYKLLIYFLIFNKRKQGKAGDQQFKPKIMTTNVDFDNCVDLDWDGDDDYQRGDIEGVRGDKGFDTREGNTQRPADNRGVKIMWF